VNFIFFLASLLAQWKSGFTSWFSGQKEENQPWFTVWCSHLTVNLQCNLLIFTPKCNFGVKTGILQWFSWFAAAFLVCSCKAATIFTKNSLGPCYFGEVNWRWIWWHHILYVVQVIPILRWGVPSSQNQVHWCEFRRNSHFCKRKSLIKKKMYPEISPYGLISVCISALTGWNAQKRKLLQTTSTEGWGGKKHVESGL